MQNPNVTPGAYVRFRFGGQGIELSGTVESLATDPHGEPCAWVEIAGFSGAWKLRERVDLMRVERARDDGRPLDCPYSHQSHQPGVLCAHCDQ